MLLGITESFIPYLEHIMTQPWQCMTLKHCCSTKFKLYDSTYTIQMKTLLIALVLFVSGTALAHAQDTSSVLKNYSVTVVMKVKDVSSVVPLTPARQVQFAELFKNEMDQQQSVMQADSTGVLSVQIAAATRQQFEALLSPAEFSSYSSNRRGSPYARRPAYITGGSTNQSATSGQASQARSSAKQ